MASTVTTTVHHAVVDEILSSSATRLMLHDAARPIILDARGRAPKATGRGSRSIDSASVLSFGEWEELISWDQFHYYMYFSEKGSRQRPARPFLVPALQAAQR
jgi:hypothetical protein